MALYNPYRNYDKGMDDAYTGKEPSMPQSQQYMEDYEYGQSLEDEENEFQSCSDCDGHPACQDFGCAIKAGIIEPRDY